MNLEERVEMLEFQIELLFADTSIDRLMFAYKITRAQYNAIMDLMEAYRRKIANGDSVYHMIFESDIYKIAPHKDGDYNFCEMLAKLCMENGRWDEVFPALYGDMAKYQK